MFGEPEPERPPAAQDDKLRWYQFDARDSIHENLEQHRSTLVVLATGLGKTEVFSSVARHWKHGRVLVLAHRDELVNQAYQRLRRMTGELIEIEQADLKSNKARIVVGSIQTVYREDRLQRLQRNGGFGLIIVDEAHHYVSQTYKTPFSFFPEAKLLGVTATPDRNDALALGQIFDSVAYAMDLWDGIEAGYLVPLRGRDVELTEVNIDGIDTNSNGDLSAAQLDEAILQGVEGVVKGTLKHSGDRQGVVFLPGVQSARVAAARFNAIKPGCAVSVDGETPKDERRRLMQDFKEGRIQFLTNCMVATEGFDAPTASVIALARPTKSRSLYAQMVGRGTRVLPGIVDSIEGRDGADARRVAIAGSLKPGCLLLDFVCNNSRHTLMTPEALLGGRYDEEERKRSRKIREESEGEKDVGEALEDARTQLQQERLAAAARAVKSRVKSVSRDFDPFKMLGVDQEREQQFALEYGYKPMSEKQYEYLVSQGFSPKALEKVSARSAKRMIGNIIKRRKEGLMSHKQAAMLARHGVSDSKVKKEAASRAIDYVKKVRNVDPMALRELVSGEEF